MTSPLAGEFFGTMILILLGDGVVAAVLLKRSKAEGSGWMVITAGWAFAVMAGVFTAIACGSSDAHLNPAVTIGFAVREGNFSKFAPYLAAQMLGAIVGAALVWLHYFPHWKETPDAAAKLGCFCTAPAIRNVLANLLSEIIATFVLVFVIGAIFSKSVNDENKHESCNDFAQRSEEHTSELQSRLHLVCRLLLEKKKTPTATSKYASSRLGRRSRWLSKCARISRPTSPGCGSFLGTAAP